MLIKMAVLHQQVQLDIERTNEVLILPSNTGPARIVPLKIKPPLRAAFLLQVVFPYPGIDRPVLSAKSSHSSTQTLHYPKRFFFEVFFEEVYINKFNWTLNKK